MLHGRQAYGMIEPAAVKSKLWASLTRCLGVVYAWASQRNMKIRLIAALLVAAGLFLGLNRVEWSVIILTVTTLGQPR